MVALKSTIHDGSISLLRDTFLGDFGIDPVGITPHLGANLAKLNRSRGVITDRVLEGLVEIPIVKENVWVMIPSVEMSLYRFDGLDDAI